jgi:hypothetical protein
LTGYFALIFHFENAHYININRSFEAKIKNKTSLARIYTYFISRSLTPPNLTLKLSIRIFPIRLCWNCLNNIPVLYDFSIF